MYTGLFIGIPDECFQPLAMLIALGVGISFVFFFCPGGRLWNVEHMDKKQLHRLLPGPLDSESQSSAGCDGQIGGNQYSEAAG